MQMQHWSTKQKLNTITANLQKAVDLTEIVKLKASKKKTKQTLLVLKGAVMSCFSLHAEFLKASWIPHDMRCVSDHWSNNKILRACKDTVSMLGVDGRIQKNRYILHQIVTNFPFAQFKKSLANDRKKWTISRNSGPPSTLKFYQHFVNAMRLAINPNFID